MKMSDADVTGGSGTPSRSMDKMHGRWLSQGRGAADAMLAASWLERASRLWTAWYEGVMRPQGVTMARWDCMAIIYWSEHGSVGLSRMSQLLAVHPTTITYVIDQLEQQGLVQRVPHPTDRRRTSASLTETGTSFVEDALDQLEASAFGLTGLETGELRELARLLSRVAQLHETAAATSVTDRGPE